MRRTENTEEKTNILNWFFKNWQRVAAVFAAVVVFVTTYALIIPAHTMQEDPVVEEKVYFCGLAEHTHSEECYAVVDGVKTLTCTIKEHVHTDSCLNKITRTMKKLTLGALPSGTLTPNPNFSFDSLVASADNDWQIVKEGYQGRTLGDKYCIDPVTNQTIDVDGDGRPDAWIQKNVVPTDVEDEFLVYLSISKPISIEDFFKNATLYLCSSNTSTGVGGLDTSLPSSWKPDGMMGPQVEGDHTGSTNYLYINLVIKEASGNVVATVIGWRLFGKDADVSNGTILVGINVNGVKKYLKMANRQDFKNVGLGSSTPYVIQLDYDILNSSVFLDNKETALGDVTDIIGEGMEFISLEYADGSVTKSTTEGGETQLLWSPEDNIEKIKVNNSGNKSDTYGAAGDFVTGSDGMIYGTYNNIAELVYKVRLKTDDADFDMCGEHIDQQEYLDYETNTECYKVNEVANFEYKRQSLTGATEHVEYEGSITYKVPYVRGTRYDLSFVKNDASTGQPMKGVNFRLTHNTLGYSWSGTTDSDGMISIYDIPGGTYTLSETVPLGYQNVPDRTLVISKSQAPSNVVPHDPNDPLDAALLAADPLAEERLKYVATGGSMLTLTNTPDPNSKVVKFKKVDPDGAAVQGAVFDLYVTKNGAKASTPRDGYVKMTSTASGQIGPDEIRLPYGTYYLTETKRPAGFIKLTDDVVIVSSASGVTATCGGTSLTVNQQGGAYVINIANTPVDLKDPEEPEEITDYAEIEKDIDVKKQIETLSGDREDLYRLHIELERAVNPVDLILLIDDTASDAKRAVIEAFLNGSTGAGDGFLAEFFDNNASNDAAVIMFDKTASVLKGFGTLNTSKTVDLPDFDEDKGEFRNYGAAYEAAEGILKTTATGRDTIVVLVADGVPTYIEEEDEANGTTLKFGNGKDEKDDVGKVFADILVNVYKAKTATAAGDDTSAAAFTELAFDILKNDGIGYSFDTYPIFNDITTAELNIPGIDEISELVVTDSLAFETFATTSGIKAAATGGATELATAAAYLRNWLSPTGPNVNSFGNAYNIFWKNEDAFYAFHDDHPEIISFAIGTSSDFTTESYEYDGETITFDEALEYIGGEDGNFICKTVAEFENIKKLLFGMDNVEIFDTLSDYAEFADELNLTVSYRLGDVNHTPVELIGSSSVTGSDITASYTKNDKDIQVTFPDYTFEKPFAVNVSFDIVPSEDAYNEYYSGSGYNAEGESGTDYPVTGVTGSSDGNDGFFSNEEGVDNAYGTATPTGASTAITKELPNPVIQVTVYTIKVEKEVLNTTVHKVFPFELTEESGYILDPKTGDGYTLSDGVASFDLAGGDMIEIAVATGTTAELSELEHNGYHVRIIEERDGQQPVSSVGDKRRVVADEDLTITVQNNAGSEMPATGSIFSPIVIRIIGLAMIAGAIITGYILRRKEKGGFNS